MPNNRNRNRNRNRNKRNKNNQNANQNKQQQQEQHEEEKEETATTSSSSLTAANDHHNDENNGNSGNISNGSTTVADETSSTVEKKVNQLEDNQSIEKSEEQIDPSEDHSEDQKEQQLEKPKQLEDQSSDKPKEEEEGLLDQPEDQLSEELAQSAKEPEKQLEDQLIDQSIEKEQELLDFSENQATEKQKEHQPVYLPEKQLLDQAVEKLQQLTDHLENQTAAHSEDQLTFEPKDQPDHPEIRFIKQTDQLIDQSAPKINSVRESLIDQLIEQPKEPVVHIVPVQVEQNLSEIKLKKERILNKSEDLLKEQPVVHLVPIKVEKEEAGQSADQTKKQPKVHLVPVKVEKEEDSIDKPVDQLKDQPEDLLVNQQQVNFIPLKVEKERSALDQLSNQTKEQPRVHFVPLTVQLEEDNAMGAKNSKQQREQQQQQQQQQSEQSQQPQQQTQKPPGSPRQAKVIVHRIVREDKQQQEEQQQQEPAQQQQQTEEQQPLSRHQEAPAQQQAKTRQQHVGTTPLQRSTKVIIHQIRVETDAEERARKGKPTIEEISSTTATPHSNNNRNGSNDNNSGTLSPPPRYLVESPSPKNVTSSVQFGKFARDVQIQELELNSDYSSGEFNLQSPVVCEADSETEMVSTPTALTAAVQHSFSPDVPSSSRAEQQEQLRQKRAQKRNALESHFLPQLLSPRYLDSILEEISETAAAGGDLSRNSSFTSSTSDSPLKTRSSAPPVPPKATESFPRSQLDFSRRHRRREEPVALMLETKLLEQPSDLESCTRLQSTLSPQSEDAELVYLSSSASSSVSDLMELELEQAAALAERALIDLDTDASKLINRPNDDEVSSTTTTEPHSSSNDTETEGECEVETEVDVDTETEAAAGQSSRESTPVNAHPTTTTSTPQPSAGSSLSSLLSAATPTPTETPAETPAATPAHTPAPTPTPAETTARELETNEANEFGSLKLANSLNAAPSLSVTREQFIRNMEKVRELIEMTRRDEEENVQNGNGNVYESNGNGNSCRLSKSPTPPPVPPPPNSLHYPAASNTFNTSNTSESHPILTPLLLKRQESNDSHCSDSTQHSQCTAINLASPPPLLNSQNPPTPPLRQQQPQQQPKLSPFSAAETDAESIKKLRLLCTETLASMPYGEQMLEELANVAQDITQQQLEQQKQQQQHNNGNNMPYPLPQLPHIGELQLSLGANNSSEQAWLGLPTQADPKLLVCLSPGQQQLLEQQQQPQQQPDQLLDAHEKFVKRRGYHELSAEQVRAMDSEQLKLEQEQILKTAAKMRELRKSLTPTSTSPTPQQQQQQQQPPPVPVKSAETAAKAKSQADDARKVTTSTAATSSFENKPKTTAAAAAADLQQQQRPYSFEERTSSRTQQQQHSSYMSSNTSNNSSNSSKFPASMESELARMFPSMAKQGDIFDEQRKRFSNIEQSLQQQLSPQTKRYSNIETSSFESKKRTENGQVVYDYSNSQRSKDVNKFPLQHTAATATVADEVDCAPPPVPPPPAAANIMSATKLNDQANTFIDDAQQQQQHQQQQKSQQQQQQQQYPTTSAAKVNGSGSSATYEECRQRAKAALAAIAQQPDSNNTQQQQSQTQGKHLDNEKLFKDFDALSQQLNAELHTSRVEREQRDKSASLYDLSRISNCSNAQQQLSQLKRERHAHMQELEREIERSAKSRQERLSSVPRQVEAREIPIELSPDYSGVRSRRAESLCNLNDAPPMRPHSSVELQQDDWSRYASDLGNSENIARPFAREVEICYQRQSQGQPRGIRAPRLSASTNDLSTGCFDSYNAYGGARRHAPMLQQAPQQQQRPHYASCYSMIERDPNPTYISTTSRRGVSPAPSPNPQPPAYDRQQRRSSLPRELHEQQLKYILSKEEELKLEFERLQQERRRLMEEMQRAPTVLQTAPPPRRESYRAAAPPKLPTLSEDEVFRQQMAEEWMHKVAEREERRQHKIIKISKIEDEQQHATEEQSNLCDEFLSRVKERRHKLSMPADSDWESGAESQPVQPAKLAGGSESSDAEAPPVRVLEGQAEANLRELPRHLREFAKFSTCEQLEDGQGQLERHEEQEKRETHTDNSHSTASKKSSIVKTYKVSRLPPSVQDDNNNENTNNNNQNNNNNKNTATTTTSTTSNSHLEHESRNNIRTTTAPATSPSAFLSNFPRNSKIDELFANSPFRSKIFEEFDKYWRNFEHTSDNF